MAVISPSYMNPYDYAGAYGRLGQSVAGAGESLAKTALSIQEQRDLVQAKKDANTTTRLGNTQDLQAKKADLKDKADEREAQRPGREALAKKTQLENTATEATREAAVFKAGELKAKVNEIFALDQVELKPTEAFAPIPTGANFTAGDQGNFAGEPVGLEPTVGPMPEGAPVAPARAGTKPATTGPVVDQKELDATQSRIKNFASTVESLAASGDVKGLDAVDQSLAAYRRGMDKMAARGMKMRPSVGEMSVDGGEKFEARMDGLITNADLGYMTDAINQYRVTKPKATMEEIQSAVVRAIGSEKLPPGMRESLMLTHNKMNVAGEISKQYEHEGQGIFLSAGNAANELESKRQKQADDEFYRAQVLAQPKSKMEQMKETQRKAAEEKRFKETGVAPDPVHGDARFGAMENTAAISTAMKYKNEDMSYVVNRVNNAKIELQKAVAENRPLNSEAEYLWRDVIDKTGGRLSSESAKLLLQYFQQKDTRDLMGGSTQAAPAPAPAAAAPSRQNRGMKVALTGTAATKENAQAFMDQLDQPAPAVRR